MLHQTPPPPPAPLPPLEPWHCPHCGRKQEDHYLAPGSCVVRVCPKCKNLLVKRT